MSAPTRDEIARFLRQRIEAGMPAITLDALDRATVAELLSAARRAGTGGRAGAGPTAAPAGTPRPIPAGTAGSSAAAAGRRPAAAAGRAGARTDVVPAAERAPSVVPASAIPGLGYDALKEAALACTRCPLAGGRTQVVFSDGHPDARVMVVGEAPGANEDRTGLPFVGAAGKLLDLMLASVDLSRRESVYICNVLKCRPPGNRNPLPEEIEACAPYLRRQVELVRPEVILAVGTFAARLLTGSQDALGKLRGTVYSYEGVPLVVTYHPAALLRNPGWRRPTWDDLQLLRGVLDAA